MRRDKIYGANVGDFFVRGTVDKIISFVEGKGYECRTNKDERMMHYYFQIADHWKAVKNERLS